jgi:hypothetical protein
MSADVDIFSDEDFSSLISEHRLGKNQKPIYIEQSPAIAFATSVDWPSRAFTVLVDNVTLLFPHPIDILISKLQRLEEKDLRAFQLVRRVTGRPTEEELKKALMNAVDLYRPPFAEETRVGDIFLNTKTVWRTLFNKDIDVGSEIIAPALLIRRTSYGQNIPDHQQALRNILRKKQ